MGAYRFAGEEEADIGGPEPDLGKKIEPILKRVMRTRKTLADKVIQMGVEYLIQESEIEFENNKQPEDSVKGAVYLQEVL